MLGDVLGCAWGTFQICLGTVSDVFKAIVCFFLVFLKEVTITFAISRHHASLIPFHL